MYTEILGAPKPRMDQETTEARPERLAFFLRKLSEAENIGICQQDALWFAGELRNTVVDSNARIGYRQIMEEKLAEFERLVQSLGRVLLVTIPAEYKGSGNYRAIAGEFCTQEPDDDRPYYILGIPTGNITAAKALPYPRKPGEDIYEPVLSMRVVDSGHEQGTWHYFPLESCKFQFYED